MKVSEVLEAFHEMPVCDRIYLLCQMLQKCQAYELAFMKTVLLGTLYNNLENLSTRESMANRLDSYSSFQNVITLDENLDRLICFLALVRCDNHLVAERVYALLNNRQILLKAEELEDLEILNKLRLVYLLAVYHPALSFHQHHQLLTIFLRHLDEIYDTKLLEEERKREEADQMAVDRPSMPSSDATILCCELQAVYKRQSDRRYPYILEVEWSDGAYSHIQRTYGDFFTFQNKLLDIFPDESGQRNKKQRVIPFLPGRKLLSGRSNKELAEKRLPELWQYTHDLFTLPEHISQCKHVLDFFRPRPSDIKEDISTIPKVTTLSDVRNKSRNPPSVAFQNTSPSSSPSRPRSAAITTAIASANSSRVSHTLPAQQSPSSKEKDSTGINRRSTYPARPQQHTSAFTPTNSTERLHSSSQTSIGSADYLTTPTTTACHVVTPPTSRVNRSPAFSISHLSNVTLSSNSSNGSKSAILENEPSTSSVTLKMMRPPKSKLSKADLNHQSSPSPPTIGKVNNEATPTSTNSWADRSSSPPKLDSYLSPFQPNSSSTTAAASTAVSSSSLAPPIPPHSSSGLLQRSVPFSPSLPQLYQYTPHSHSPYHFSYTPTNFDSPSPKPMAVSGRWPGTPVCNTPTCTSEADHFRKWLKCHRLHKYDSLFQNMTFDEVSKLSVEKMKELGMTQGAARKFEQKMNELVKNNITSFRDIPIPSISRRPSTSSLPAALLLERQLTPSSSIDQLSLHGSTCSLDVLGHTYNHHPTPTHSHRHSDSLTEATISTFDGAILETGPPSAGNSSSSNAYLKRNEIESHHASNHSLLGVANGQIRQSPLPIHQAPPTYSSTTPTQRDQVISFDVVPMQYHAHVHKKDSAHAGYMDRIQHTAIPTNHIQGGGVAPNWTHPPLPTVLIPPMIRPNPSPAAATAHRGPVLAYAPINGLLRSPAAAAGVGTVSRYPVGVTPTVISSSASSVVARSSSSCYKCGSRGHSGSSCTQSRVDPSSAGVSHISPHSSTHQFATATRSLPSS